MTSSTPDGSTGGAGTQSTEALLGSLTTLRNSIQTPESLGWAIVNYVLTEGATQGTLESGRIDVPLTASITLPATESGADLVSELCITVLGHQLACIHLHSHTETT